ncbi:MAG: cyclic pyranopterin monophosphate synthase MoaC [Sphingobium sp. 32-64-5]|nr:MAG: cyclic pyranopterin monophosphate synthase MoaC [Sphingobium sp. 32-64-5]
MPRLTHIDDRGAAHMVDVSGKAETVRQAIATGRIDMNAQALAALTEGSAQKGDVLAVARIAGIMAAKKTSELIPLCHPLPINKISIDLVMDDKGVIATATVRTEGKTGVEMEAMTAASVALLTVYDMAKSLDKGMIIRDIHLIEKTGGKSGDWRAG